MSVSRSVGLRPSARPTRCGALSFALRISSDRMAGIPSSSKPIDSSLLPSTLRTRRLAQPASPLGRCVRLLSDSHNPSSATSASSGGNELDVSLFPPTSSFRSLFASRIVFGIPGRPGMNTSWLSRAHSSSSSAHPAKRYSGSRMSLFRHTSRWRRDLQSPMESGSRTSALRDALRDTSDVRLPSPSGRDDRSLESSCSRVSIRIRPTDSASAPSSLLRRASSVRSAGVHSSSVSGNRSSPFLATTSSLRRGIGPSLGNESKPFASSRRDVALAFASRSFTGSASPASAWVHASSTPAVPNASASLASSGGGRLRRCESPQRSARKFSASRANASPSHSDHAPARRTISPIAVYPGTSSTRTRASAPSAPPSAPSAPPSARAAAKDRKTSSAPGGRPAPSLARHSAAECGAVCSHSSHRERADERANASATRARSTRLAAGDIPGPMRRSNRSSLAALSSFHRWRFSSVASFASSGAIFLAAASSASTARTLSRRARSSPYHRRVSWPLNAVWIFVAASCTRRWAVASSVALVSSARMSALGPTSASLARRIAGVSVERRSAETAHIASMRRSSAPVAAASCSTLGAIATAGGRRAGRCPVAVASGPPTVAAEERPSQSARPSRDASARRDATDAGV